MEIKDGMTYDEAPEYEEERAKELVKKGFVEILEKPKIEEAKPKAKKNK